MACQEFSKTRRSVLDLKRVGSHDHKFSILPPTQHERRMLSQHIALQNKYIANISWAAGDVVEFRGVDSVCQRFRILTVVQSPCVPISRNLADFFPLSSGEGIRVHITHIMSLRQGSYLSRRAPRNTTWIQDQDHYDGVDRK